ncbi:hypothetical protein [Ruegeria arenilitoris]|uniref:hypothetical protein n=1 Tax=Ruegeria arenilitoris TaxID=1173585 RepID=UPI0014808745|nr:hypothetical protein [Ruegeria arenilitoris]
MSDNNPQRRNGAERLAAMISALLVLLIMTNAIEGYFDAVFGYFRARLGEELGFLATLATYVLSAGIAYEFFKIVLTAILMGSIFKAMQGGSPLSILGLQAAWSL